MQERDFEVYGDDAYQFSGAIADNIDPSAFAVHIRNPARLSVNRAIAILQLVMLAAILSFGYWRKRRAGRSTYSDT